MSASRSTDEVGGAFGVSFFGRSSFPCGRALAGDLHHVQALEHGRVVAGEAQAGDVRHRIPVRDAQPFFVPCDLENPLAVEQPTDLVAQRNLDGRCVPLVRPVLRCVFLSLIHVESVGVENATPAPLPRGTGKRAAVVRLGHQQANAVARRAGLMITSGRNRTPSGACTAPGCAAKSLSSCSASAWPSTAQSP